jgi:osmotically-inducible protein OsmY
MPNRTYDDIVRTTVPNPDSSHRPTRSEEHDAVERGAGPRIHQATPGDEGDDTTTEAAVRDALASLGTADLADLDITIEGARLQVDGSVASKEDRDVIVRRLEGVPGVVAVIDTLRIRNV